MSAPVRTPESKRTGAAPAAAFYDAGERVERADAAVDLSPAVVAHHEAPRAAPKRLAGIVRVQHPFDDHGKPRHAHEAFEVVPREGRA